ncbi:hypothetical protein NPIL_334371 [Nephila pilipes]|uniref:DUF4817 domain-containing protein n=1 Tax=Nephila pilipes TaxID=299642 RepID=A0A8X6PC03_NEPPI|nr:hypothetical protein NPIL_334371 [Nephila pilipes]
MLSGKDKDLLMKLFYMNEESATVALRKFRLQKNEKTGKRSLTVANLVKLVQRFEEIGSLEDRVRSERPSLRQSFSVCETLESESSVGSNSARYDTSGLLAMGVFKIPGVTIPSIQFVGIERCNPSRSVLHTAGDSALCRCWTYNTPSMCYPLAHVEHIML